MLKQVAEGVLVHESESIQSNSGTARCAASIRDVLSTADWKSAPLEWLPDVHCWQLQRLAQRSER